MLKFDVLSDVHLDETLGDKTIEQFVSEILPQQTQEILVFAGDFGYSNEQNVVFLRELKKHYEVILVVLGNNDMKLSKSNPEGFQDVYARIGAFCIECSRMTGVYRLDGTTYTDYKSGITFGGTDIFYDYDDIKENLLVDDEYINEQWIKKGLHIKHRGWINDPKAYAEDQKQKLREVLPVSDVIITHGPPNYFRQEDDKTFGFFRFEADEFKFSEQLRNKIWVYGHDHHRSIHLFNDCLFVNASYLGEKDPKIMTVTAHKRITEPTEAHGSKKA